MRETKINTHQRARLDAIMRAREEDGKTFTEIAAEIGVSVTEIRRIYRHELFELHQKHGGLNGLTSRVRRFLIAEGFTESATADDVQLALPRFRKNLGKIMLREVEQWIAIANYLKRQHPSQ